LLKIMDLEKGCTYIAKFLFKLCAVAICDCYLSRAGP